MICNPFAVASANVRRTRQVETAQDDRQKIIEMVGNAAGEATDGLKFLRLPERFFGALPLVHLA